MPNADKIAKDKVNKSFIQKRITAVSQKSDSQSPERFVTSVLVGSWRVSFLNDVYAHPRYALLYKRCAPIPDLIIECGYKPYWGE